jgi:hypothetical protein
MRFCRGRFNSVCVILLVLSTWAMGIAHGKEAVRIFKLNMQSPGQIATVLRATFGREIRVAEAPMVNGVVVSTERESLFADVEALIQQLDAVPRSLRYHVRMASRDQLDRNAFGIGVNANRQVFSLSPQLEQTMIRATGGETRMILGMEGQPVALSSEMIRVETFASPWGPQDAIRKERRGVFVSGRLVDNDRQAMVEISYAEGEFNDSRKIQTQVCVPLETWVCLGDLSGDNSGGNSSTEIFNRSGRVSRNRGRSEGTRVYFIRIEKAR